MQMKSLALAAALLAAASLAQANATHASFNDVTGSVAFDGWNQINRAGLGCGNDSACSTAKLVAGITANVAGSGDAVLKRESGDHYPAGFGLYGGSSVLTLSDATLSSGIGSLVFQGIINNFDAPFTLTLNYNGGSQALAATSSSSTLTNGVADYYSYTWDVSSLGALGSYTLTLNAGFSQMLAFQVDQVAAAPVPEPSTYALMAGGLGLVGWLARRRQAGAKQA